MKRDDLISPAYLDEQRRLHADPRGYGTKGKKWADRVHRLAGEFPVFDAVLDYGCGANTLAAALNARGIRTRSYDPAIPAFAALPKRSDFVVCADVLEHVEPDKLEAVIDHLRELTRRAAYIVVSTSPTSKTLSDGRQAHISLHAESWWKSTIGRRFTIERVFADDVDRPDKELAILVTPKGNE